MECFAKYIKAASPDWCDRCLITLCSRLAGNAGNDDIDGEWSVQCTHNVEDDPVVREEFLFYMWMLKR
jgi:hypothetical protein